MKRSKCFISHERQLHGSHKHTLASKSRYKKYDTVMTMPAAATLYNNLNQQRTIT